MAIAKCIDNDLRLLDSVDAPEFILQMMIIIIIIINIYPAAARQLMSVMGLGSSW